MASHDLPSEIAVDTYYCGFILRSLLFYVTVSTSVVIYCRSNGSLTAEEEQVRKIHNMSFRHLGILLLHKNTKMAKIRIVNFSDLFPFCS
jgi:hypothetical protein